MENSNQPDNITKGELLGLLHRGWWDEIPNNADFYSHINQQFWVEVWNLFNYKTKRPIVFLPCASKKPISKSRTHCYLSPITRDKNLEQIIISEPQTIIPYCLESQCPNYDYSPDQLTNKDRWQLIRRLGIFLSHLQEENPHRQRIYYIGGGHHLQILTEANQNLPVQFTIHSSVPKRGIRDYYTAAVEFKKLIYKTEQLIQEK